MSEELKGRGQEPIPENWTGRRVKVRGTKYEGTVVGPCVIKPRTGGVGTVEKGAWFIRIDGLRGEDFRYEENELEVLK